ncbi:MAG: hypothetical protein XD50_0304 [Clostridia bacterium 41_269]|nr:MAG: hypothetical protein XD50_0304 [Clostridia bacterium 41_269]
MADDFDLITRIKMMSQYLDSEAIAEALHLTPEIVEDILSGKAEVEVREKQAETVRDTSIIKVSSVRTAYRQKIISVVRSKGGVGSSLVAFGLSFLLSSDVRTLLVLMTFEEGISDLVYAVNPESIFNSYSADISTLKNAEGYNSISLGHNFDLIEIKSERIISGYIAEIADYAKRNYDAVVFDLPNKNSDPSVIEAVDQSTTLVAVTSGHMPEMVRLASFLAKYPQKEIFLIANMCPEPRIEGLTDFKKIKLDFDPSMNKAYREGEFPGMRFSFMKGMAKLKDMIYAEQRKSLLQKIFSD